MAALEEKGIDGLVSSAYQSEAHGALFMAEAQVRATQELTEATRDVVRELHLANMLKAHERQVPSETGGSPLIGELPSEVERFVRAELGLLR